jgi:hypothetical protein
MTAGHAGVKIFPPVLKPFVGGGYVGTEAPPHAYSQKWLSHCYTELFVAEGDQGVDAGGAAGWDPAGHDSGDEQEGGYGG